MHFKANLEVKNGKYEDERIVYIQQPSIIGAYEVCKKIRPSKIVSIITIDRKTYIRGVSK